MLTVAWVQSQVQSGSLADTGMPVAPEGAGALSCMEVPRQPCISACPSQKEKPQPLPWAVAGKSTHLGAPALTAKPPSLMLQGLSSSIKKICEPLTRVKSDDFPKVAQGLLCLLPP